MTIASYKKLFNRLFSVSKPRLVQPVTVMGELYGYAFLCPGCETRHYLPTNVSSDDGRSWIMSGDETCPSFYPSHRLVIPHEEKSDTVCHVLVKEGMLDFFIDSTHGKAGEIVPMLPVE